MSQSGAARRNLTNGYARMGKSMQRPRIKGASMRSVSESIQAARNAAARAAKITKKK
jgi:hypothetical protein